MSIEERFKPGDFIRHFKREDSDDLNFLYVYVGTAVHTETGERLAVYRALYGREAIYARPLEMFNEMVDNRPRFEKATLEDLNAIQNAYSS